MIHPTVGRVVHFYRYFGAEVQAALIAHVNDDGTVNLAVFDHHGNPEPRPSNVMLVQEGQNPCADVQFCTWMPYQLGQAAKTEALEAQLKPINSMSDVTTFASETQMNFGGVFAQSNGIVEPIPTLLDVVDTPVPAEAMTGHGGMFDGGGASGDFDSSDYLKHVSSDLANASIKSELVEQGKPAFDGTPVAYAAASYDSRPSETQPSSYSDSSSSSSSDSGSSSSSD